MILSANSQQPTELELIGQALERLADSLLARHQIWAAHFCYLLVPTAISSFPVSSSVLNEQDQPVRLRLPSRIRLIGLAAEGQMNALQNTGPSHHSADSSNIEKSGVARRSESRFEASIEAIQLTEIYEYAMRLADRRLRIFDLMVRHC
ncbi:unnamed protein product [Protopolystoma xenopodis]|uniref:Uncharacterized protein n=1 Tax=Protopolystoma xenopodis TaxID=117903 RepID=A0A3S5ABS6_9PLAT|nr:unnamed protein product [Protopolystoma xenopodis]